MTPWGSVNSMSLIFLRTWYQASDTAFGPLDPFRYMKIVD